MRFNDFHQSGKFDAGAKWAQAIVGATERASIGSFTEAKGRHVAPPGWGQFDGKTECPVIWDEAKWEFLGALPLTFTERSWFLGDRVTTGHQRHGVEGPGVLLEHKASGLTLLRLALHVPSSIQGGAEWSRKPADLDNVAAAQSALVNAGRTIRRMRWLTGADAVTVAADFNLHLGMAAWVNRVERDLDDLHLLVAGEGTHHERTIDAHATDLAPAGPVRLLPKVPGFDHRGVVVATHARAA